MMQEDLFLLMAFLH
jgi:hypothetical protein